MADGLAFHISTTHSTLQPADKADSLLGRQPSKPPSHFTRVLYIPRHDRNTDHLPVFEIGDWYRQAMGDTLIGSSLYTVQLGLMHKPRPKSNDAPLAYTVNLEQTQNQGGIVYAKRAISVGWQDPAAQVIIGSSLDAGCSLIVRFPNSSDSTLMRMTTSFPIPATQRKKHTIPHPYFTFTLPASPSITTPSSPNPGEQKGPKIFQWQIHPVQNGLLRYTLIDLGASPSSTPVPLRNSYHNDDDRNDNNNNNFSSCSSSTASPWETGVHAIYHHAGLVESLSEKYSEGVLLLPEPTDRDQAAWEGAIVASLMGMLWLLRSIDVKSAPSFYASPKINTGMAAGGPTATLTTMMSENVKLKTKTKTKSRVSVGAVRRSASAIIPGARLKS